MISEVLCVGLKRALYMCCMRGKHDCTVSVWSVNPLYLVLDGAHCLVPVEEAHLVGLHLVQ
jgi:hypothetical protein